ncbi:MAG: CPBP family intramembrane glutamic endopeptidase [Saprospiraceae bacterium]
MNSESKDATVNLLLLVLFVLLATFGFFALISLTFLSHDGLNAALSKGLDTKALFEKLSGKELNILQSLSQIIGLIIPAFLLTKYKKSVSSYIEQKPFYLKFAMLAFALFICAYPSVSFLTYINQQIPLPDWMISKESEMTDMIKQLLTMNSFIDLSICMISIALIPAIAEEWIFRGILQNQLIRFFKNKWLGMILTAFIFSAIHLQFEGFLPRFALGLILGYVYLLGGSLKYSILLHFFFNGIQVFAVYLNGSNLEQTDLSSTIQTPSFYLFLSASIVGMFYFISMMLKFQNSKNV